MSVYKKHDYSSLRDSRTTPRQPVRSVFEKLLASVNRVCHACFVLSYTLLAGLFALALPSMAQVRTALDRVEIGFDTDQVTEKSEVVRDKQILWRAYPSSSAVLDLGLPERSEVNALGKIGDSTIWVPDTTIKVAGLVISPRDVAQTADGTTSIYASGAQLGIPEGVKIDAVEVSEGALYLSFDTTVQLGAETVKPSDIVRAQESQLSIHIRGSDLGIPQSANLNALGYIDEMGLLFSLDTSVNVSGLTFQSGDIIEVNLSSGSWSLNLSRSELGVIEYSPRITALSIILDRDVLYRGRFENGEL